MLSAYIYAASEWPSGVTRKVKGVTCLFNSQPRRGKYQHVADVLRPNKALPHDYSWVYLGRCYLNSDTNMQKRATRKLDMINEWLLCHLPS